MSQWATAASAHRPVLYAIDPETEGEPLAPVEELRLSAEAGRRYLATLLEGLGYEDTASSLRSSATAKRYKPRPVEVTTIETPAGEQRFIGSVFGPRGRIGRLVEIVDMLSDIPDEIRDQLVFFGVDLSALADARMPAFVQAPTLRAYGDVEFGDGRRRGVLGADGTIVAGLDAVATVQELPV
jgi:hypothetical protein